MKCPACEKELKENLVTCPNCGTPLKEENGEYVKGDMNISYGKKPVEKSKRAEIRLIEKNRIIASICSIFSLPLLIGGIILMSMAFFTLGGSGTVADPGINGMLEIAPYSIVCIAPALVLGIVAFFRSRGIPNFKSVYVLSCIEVVACGILTIVSLSIILAVFTRISF